MVRRVLRSHPVLWSKLDPELRGVLQGTASLQQFDVGAIENMVRSMAEDLRGGESPR